MTVTHCLVLCVSRLDVSGGHKMRMSSGRRLEDHWWSLCLRVRTSVRTSVEGNPAESDTQVSVCACVSEGETRASVSRVLEFYPRVFPLLLLLVFPRATAKGRQRL